MKLDAVNRFRGALGRPRRVVLVLGALTAGAGLYIANLRGSVIPCSGEQACDASIHAAPAAEGLTGKPRLVEFTSGYCPACKRMAPIVAELEKKCARSVAGAIHQVDVDDPDGEALATRYGVRSLPTFLALDAQGSEVARLVGLQSQEKLSSTLDTIRACPTL
ncbi:thioredoxin family protein [Chondromyces apiculatus]|uniref:Cytochrome c biogenesis protein n=1 Tax=Chondromyces apiculatus DSM 436 TaxID=1192034 RepID=A0A017T8T2_9BACT|nr:thioredoxin family protein [Chondromyces apiculatus]EYF05663.1 cytochrome c biogenesis protein [Chondromyces apiculatus DSM 436]